MPIFDHETAMKWVRLGQQLRSDARAKPSLLHDGTVGSGVRQQIAARAVKAVSDTPLSRQQKRALKRARG